MKIEAGDWAEKLVFKHSAEEVEAAFAGLDAGGLRVCGWRS